MSFYFGGQKNQFGHFAKPPSSCQTCTWWLRRGQRGDMAASARGRGGRRELETRDTSAALCCLRPPWRTRAQHLRSPQRADVLCAAAKGSHETSRALGVQLAVVSGCAHPPRSPVPLPVSPKATVTNRAQSGDVGFSGRISMTEGDSAQAPDGTGGCGAAPYPEAPAYHGEVTTGLGHAGEMGDGHRVLRSRLPHCRPLRS